MPDTAYVSNSAPGSGTLNTPADPFPTYAAAFSASAEHDIISFQDGSPGSPETYNLSASEGDNSSSSGARILQSDVADRDSVIIRSAEANGVLYWSGPEYLDVRNLTFETQIGNQSTASKGVRADSTTELRYTNIKIICDGQQSHLFSDAGIIGTNCAAQGFVRESFLQGAWSVGATIDVSQTQHSYSIDDTASAASHQGCYRMATSNAGVTLSITGDTGEPSRTADIGTSKLRYVYSEGMTTNTIEDNVVAIDGVTEDADLILIRDDTVIACTQVRISGNNLINVFGRDVGTFPTGQYGIRIGEDGPAIGLGISDVQVHDNIINGCAHGYMFGGGSANAAGWANEAENTEINYLVKDAGSDVGWQGDRVTNPISSSSSGCIILKAADESVIANLSGTIGASFANPGIVVNNSGAVYSTAAQAKNYDLTFGAVNARVWEVQTGATDSAEDVLVVLAAESNNFNLPSFNEDDTSFSQVNSTNYSARWWWDNIDPNMSINGIGNLGQVVPLKGTGVPITALSQQPVTDFNGAPWAPVPSRGDTELALFRSLTPTQLTVSAGVLRIDGAVVALPNVLYVSPFGGVTDGPNNGPLGNVTTSGSDLLVNGVTLTSPAALYVSPGGELTDTPNGRPIANFLTN